MSSKNNIMAAFLNPKTIKGSAASREFAVRMIDINLIRPNERDCYRITNIEGLAFEMELNGNHVDPLEVMDNGDGTFRLIAGHRRRAAVLLRLERGDEISPEVPCMVKEYRSDDLLTAEERELVALIASNSQREKSVFEKLNEITALEPLARKIYDSELAQKKISGSFRKFFSDNFLKMSSSALQRIQSLSKLSDEGRQALENEKISETVAAILASLDEEQQLEYLIMLEDGLIENTVTAIQEFKKNINDSSFHAVNDEDISAGTAEADNLIASDRPGGLPAEEGSESEDSNGRRQEPAEEIASESPQNPSGDVPDGCEYGNKNDSQADASSGPESLQADIAIADDDEAEKKAVEWATGALMELKDVCQKNIDMAQKAGDSKSEAFWMLRKAKILLAASALS